MQVWIRGAREDSSFREQRLEPGTPVRRERREVVRAKLIEDDDDDETGWLLGVRCRREQQDRHDGGQQSKHAWMLAGRRVDAVTVPLV